MDCHCVNVQVFDGSDERLERVIKRTATLYLDLLQPRLQKGRLMPAGRHKLPGYCVPLLLVDRRQSATFVEVRGQVE